MMPDLDLPPDLVSGLSGPTVRTLDAGAYGTIRLVSLEHLHLEILELTPNYAPSAPDDPHRYDGGYYAVPAVNLIDGEADWPSYFPRLAFLWLPTERRFGTFDQDHGELMLYQSGLEWPQIAGDAEAYLLAGESCGNDRIPMEYFKPWPRYPYVLPSERETPPDEQGD